MVKSIKYKNLYIHHCRLSIQDLSKKSNQPFIKNHKGKKYTIIYNKLFVLEIVGKDEYVITYNVDQGNVQTIPDNTILVHRKKESNTLYTINALNELIKKNNDVNIAALILFQ